MDKIEERTILKGIYRDTYNLLLKYIDIGSSQEQWLNLVREIGKLSNKYNNKLCYDILKSIFEYLECKYNQNKTK